MQLTSVMTSVHVLSCVPKFWQPKLLHHLSTVYHGKYKSIAMILNGTQPVKAKLLLAEIIQRVFRQKGLSVSIVTAPVDWSREDTKTNLTLILRNKENGLMQPNLGILCYERVALGEQEWQQLREDFDVCKTLEHQLVSLLENDRR